MTHASLPSSQWTRTINGLDIAYYYDADDRTYYAYAFKAGCSLPECVGMDVDVLVCQAQATAWANGDGPDADETIELAPDAAPAPAIVADDETYTLDELTLLDILDRLDADEIDSAPRNRLAPPRVPAGWDYV